MIAVALACFFESQTGTGKCAADRTSPAPDHVSSFSGNHDDRGGGVAGDDLRHHRGIDNAQAIEAIEAQARVDDGGRTRRLRIEQCFAMVRSEERNQFAAMLVEFDQLLGDQKLTDIAAFRDAADKEMKMFEDNYVF